MNRIHPPTARPAGRAVRASKAVCSAALLLISIAPSPGVATPLMSTSPSQALLGTQSNSNFGDVAQTAGDLNQDGYSDLIIGARVYANGQGAEGSVSVYLGAPSGLASSPLTLESNVGGGEFGAAVACLGDVQGAGFGDIAVGAPGIGAGGEVWIFEGSGSFNLQNHAVLSGPTAASDFGRGVAGVGDVNGDGFRDLVVGAPAFTNGQNQEGKIYLFLGSASGIGTSAAWTFESNAVGAQLGTRLSAAGDVNGDGFADLIAGTPRYANGQAREGRLWLFLGSPTGFAAAPNWTYESNQTDAQLGVSVGNAGDINGDGYADVIAGADNFDTSLADAGQALLFLGIAAGLTTTPAGIFSGTQTGGNFGRSVGTAGDVNGDSYADFVVGAPGEDASQVDAGRVHLYLGGHTVPTGATFVLAGTEASGALGRLVGTAGDVQDDGFSDVIAGSSQIDLGATNAGAIFVYRGAAAAVRATAGWTKNGAPDQGYAGMVGILGDTNGDGYDDLFVAASTIPHGTDKGEIHIHRGSANGTTTTPSQVLVPPSADGPILSYGGFAFRAGDLNADGFDDLLVNFFVDHGASGWVELVDLWFGSAGGLQFGKRFANPNATSNFISAAGDLNGDGFADLIGSEWDYSQGLTDRGRVFVYNGSRTGPDSFPDWERLGDEASGYFGAGFAAIGDLDNDGFDDIAIRSYTGPVFGDRRGRIQIFRGSADGLAANPAWTLTGPTPGNQFGVRMCGIGDVNGDGFADIAIDEDPYPSGVALVHIYHGSASGPIPAPNDVLTDGLVDSGFGSWIAFAGDVNADGYSDLFINRTNLAANLPGEVLLYLGNAGGLPEDPAQIYSEGEAGDGFGFPCFGGGDLDGDGYSDLLGAARYASTGSDVNGAVYLHYGNDGAARDRSIRPELVSSSARIATAGRATEQSLSFEIASLLRSAAGRARVRLRLAVSGEGDPLWGHHLVGVWVDTGAPSGSQGSAILVKQPFTPNEAAATWRASILSSDPFFPHSAWFSPEGNAATAIDLRFIPLTAAVEGAEATAALSLAPPTPNPARGPAEIRFTLARPASIDLSIFDVQGRRVAQLLHGEAPAGVATLTWTGRGDNGRLVPEGVYFVRLSAPAGEATQRIVRVP